MTPIEQGGTNIEGVGLLLPLTINTSPEALNELKASIRRKDPQWQVTTPIGIIDTTGERECATAKAVSALLKATLYPEKQVDQADAIESLKALGVVINLSPDGIPNDEIQVGSWTLKISRGLGTLYPDYWIKHFLHETQLPPLLALTHVNFEELLATNTQGGDVLIFVDHCQNYNFRNGMCLQRESGSSSDKRLLVNYFSSDVSLPIQSNHHLVAITTRGYGSFNPNWYTLPVYR